ncbi:MAG TPA: hypothetical protein VF062_08680 [Candidatus Limnocylindrales bacterium]
MYAWIWRKLPFGLYGKLAGSILLAGTVSALLWFFVFPVIEPAIMPNQDVQVGDPADPEGGPGPADIFTPSPSAEDHELGYETDEPVAPSPTPSRRR